jgi:hypothetical protein
MAKKLNVANAMAFLEKRTSEGLWTSSVDLKTHFKDNSNRASTVLYMFHKRGKLRKEARNGQSFQYQVKGAKPNIVPDDIMVMPPDKIHASNGNGHALFLNGKLTPQLEEEERAVTEHIAFLNRRLEAIRTLLTV